MANQRPTKSLTYQVLDDVEERKLSFLWYPYIPSATLTMLYGYGGMGKSWITCAVAADISTGRPLPGHKVGMPPQKVLMINAEDSPGVILKPRMRALGADLKNIIVSEQNFFLDPASIRSLEETMRQVAATVVVLDPLVSYLGGAVDMNRSNETRAVLKPLTDAAENTGCAIILVHHSRKDAGGRAANRMMGSADFTNGVRSTLMVDQDKGGQTFMSHVKHNWSKPGPALGYRIKDDVFEWTGPYSASDGGSIPQISTKPRQTDRAKDYLSKLLKHGEATAIEVEEKALILDLSMSTINKIKIGHAYSRRVADVGWVWGLEGRKDDPNYVKLMPERRTPKATLAKLGRGPVTTDKSSVTTDPNIVSDEIIAAARAAMAPR